MGMLITLQRRSAEKRAMPLEVILGDTLRYGSYEEDAFHPGKMDEKGFVAYLPEALGRGFRVIWTPKETEVLQIRILTPTSEAELNALYDALARMLPFWEARLLIGGEETDGSAFLAGRAAALQGNRQSLRSLLGAMPAFAVEQMELNALTKTLILGQAEAERFCRESAAFDRWLHTQQTV